MEMFIRAKDLTPFLCVVVSHQQTFCRSCLFENWCTQFTDSLAITTVDKLTNMLAILDPNGEWEVSHWMKQSKSSLLFDCREGRSCLFCSDVSCTTSTKSPRQSGIVNGSACIYLATVLSEIPRPPVGPPDVLMVLNNACCMIVSDSTSKFVWAVDHSVAKLEQVLDLWVQFFHVLYIVVGRLGVGKMCYSMQVGAAAVWQHRDEDASPLFLLHGQKVSWFVRRTESTVPSCDHRFVVCYQGVVLPLSESSKI